MKSGRIRLNLFLDFDNLSLSVNAAGRANFVRQFELAAVRAFYECRFVQLVMGSSFTFAVFGTSSLLYSHMGTS